MKSLRQWDLPLLFLLLTLIPWGIAAAMAEYVHAPIGLSGSFPLLGDPLLPLLLMAATLFTCSRLCAVIAVLCGFAVAVMKTTALLLYQQALMPFNSNSVKMIWAHTDHSALTAFLGSGYLWWCIPLLLLAAAVIVFFCVGAWKKDWKALPFRKIWCAAFTLLFLLSVAANVCHFLDSRRDPQEIYNGHLVTPLPAVIAGEIQTLCRPQVGKQPLSPESRQILSELKVIAASPGSPVAACFDRIIIVAVESLDLDFIGACNPQMPPGITPELDRLTAEFPHLLRYYTAAQPTSWGLGALLLSRLDFDRDRENPPAESLFSVAEQCGYATSYFSPLSGLFGDNRKSYQELFRPRKQYFLEEWQREFHLAGKYQWGISDGELYDGVLTVLRRLGEQKFIALVSTMDTHPDYTAAGAGADDPRFVGEPFLNALHSADRQLGDFVRRVMADKSLYDERTLIVVTADHTATHGRNYLRRSAYLPERIPLIFITPQKELFAGIPQKRYASSIDLAPTLLQLIGAPTPPPFMGRSLFSGKNLAVSRTMDDELLLRSSALDSVIDLRRQLPAQQPQKAFYEWFCAQY